MQVWSNLLVVLQILSAVIMIGLVLLQHGKGADMGASFGSGASGSLFGATGSANFLSRSTAVCATIFFAATLGLSVIATHRTVPAAVQSTGSTSNRLESVLAAPAASAAASVAPSAATSAPAAAASPAASAAPAIPTK
jgi:preprotein translocase subunit SecG